LPPLPPLEPVAGADAAAEVVTASFGLGLRRPAVHQAYLADAPVAQLLLFASAALGYRPP
jgi:hypothetical protein